MYDITICTLVGSGDIMYGADLDTWDAVPDQRWPQGKNLIINTEVAFIGLLEV